MQSMQTRKPIRAICARIDDSLASWIDDQTARHGISIADVTRIALNEKRDRERRQAERVAS
jgi:hypothetical protein